MIKRLMKGAAIEEVDFDRLAFPIYGAPKIDGFRCVLGDRPLTSSLARFPNRHFDDSLRGLLPEPLLDSEVVVGKRKGKGVLGRTSSGLTRQEGIPDFTLWCFDTPQVGYTKRDRLQLTKQIVDHLKHPKIRFLKHELLGDISEVKDYLDLKLEQEYEGIMLYGVNGFYKFGKGTMREQVMLKVKPFDTAEGRIKGWFEEEANNNEVKTNAAGKNKRSSAKAGKTAKGSLGGFILVDCKTGIEVRVGGGFTKRQREGLWKLIEHSPGDFLGTLVRYKKQRVGEKDKPRHPGFVEFSDFRPEWDFVED